MTLKICTLLPYLKPGESMEARAELYKFWVPYGFAKQNIKEMAFKNEFFPKLSMDFWPRKSKFAEVLTAT